MENPRIQWDTFNFDKLNKHTTYSLFLLIFLFGNSFSLSAQNFPCSPVNIGNNMSSFQNHTTLGLSNSGVANPNCGGAVNADIWFAVVAPAAGQISIVTLPGTMTDAAMAVYSGSCANLTQIACTIDDACGGSSSMPILTVHALTPGQTYYIRIWAENGSPNGTFDIRISNGTFPLATIPFQPTGVATLSSPDCIQMTTTQSFVAGCAWDPTPVNFNQAFCDTVLMNFGTNDLMGADGITWVYHNDPAGLSACGATGANIGGNGITNSFIIEFDTWDNLPAFGDIPSDHVAVNINGAMGVPINGPIALPNIEDGLFHETIFCWDPVGTSYDIYFDGVLVLSGIYDIINNLWGGTPTATCGFTSSTGGSVNIHSVCEPQTPNYNGGSQTYVEVEICEGDTYFAGGLNQTTSGIYTDTYTGFNFCDSIIITDLTVNQSSNTNLTLTVCDGECVMVGSANYCNSGTFSQTLTNYLNCDSVVVLNLTVVDVSATIVTPPPAVSCTNPTVTLDASGSSPAASSFMWTTSNGNIVGSPTQSTATVDQGGNYQVVVSFPSSAGACTGSFSVNVTENISLPTINIIPPGLLDCLNATQTIDASGSTSGPGINYNWTGPGIISGNGTSSIQVNAAGMYTLTILNTNNGCSATEMVNIIADNTEPTVTILPPTLLDCNNSTVILDASNSSSGGGFNYNWTGIGIVSGGNTLTPTVNMGGVFTLTITNTINGCTDNQSTFVTEDTTPPPISIAQPGTIDCNNSTLTLNGNGSGTNNSNFIWTAIAGGVIQSGANTLTPTISEPGVYTLTVTDLDNGCTADGTVVVFGDTDPPTADAGADVSIDCNTANGQVMLNGMASGGNNLNIVWSTGNGNIFSGGNTATPTVDMPGTYTITVTNLTNGCTAEDMVEVTSNAVPPTISILPPAQIGCGAASITIDASASSSGLNFDYSWTGPGIVGANNTAIISVNMAGDYTLTITNTTNNCSINEMVMVTGDNTPPPVMIVQPIELDCNNIMVLLDGTGSGNGNDLFEWTGPGIVGSSSNITADANVAGQYTLIVTDQNNGCTADAMVTILENITPPTIDAGADEVIDCSASTLTLSGSIISAGANSSAAWTTVDGSIINNANTLNPDIDTIGTYTLTVTDGENGCTAEDFVTITQDTNVPTVTIAVPGSINCMNSTVTLDGTGSDDGTGFDVLWTTMNGSISAGANTLMPTVTEGGTYTLIITNLANNCSHSEDAIVTEDPGVPVVEIAMPDTLDCNTSSITLTASNPGGTGAITIAWTTMNGNIVGDGDTLIEDVDAPGSYTITITNDGNGCAASETVIVEEDIATPNADAGLDQSIGCAQPNIDLDGTLSSTGSNFSYIWTDDAGGITATDTLTPSVGSAGDYILTVTNDDTGCFSTDTVTVSQDTDLPVIDVAVVDTLTCDVLSVQIDASNSDNGADFTFTWQTIDGNFLNGQNTLTPEVDTSAIYTLTITNTINNCETSEDILVEQNGVLPNLSIANPSVLDCNNTSLILGGATNDDPNTLAINWTTQDGNIVGDNMVLEPTIDQIGTYILTLTNTDNGCESVDSVMISEDVAMPMADAGADMTIVCSSPNVTLTGSDGGANFESVWENSNGDTVAQNTLMPTIASAGIYTLIITNTTNGCTNTDQVEVIADANVPQVEIAPADLITCNDGMITLDASNSDNGSPFELQWTTVNGTIVSGDTAVTPVISAAGTYTLTVNNSSNGCANSLDVIVQEDLTEPSIQIEMPGILNCMVIDTTLDATASGDPSTFAIQWETTGGIINAGAQTLTPEIAAPGTYTLTLTNNGNGCADTQDIIVIQDTTPPIADAGIDMELTCMTTSLQLDGSNSSGAINLSYLWSSINGNIVSGGNDANPTVDASGTYLMVVTNTDNGCTATDETDVTPSTDLPNVEIVTPDSLTCADLTIQLDASNSDNGTDFQFTWNTLDGSFDSGQNSLTPIVNASGTYTLTIDNMTNGCSNSTSVLVEENMPTIDIQLLSTDTINCNNVNATIVTESNGGTNATYLWTTLNGTIESGVNDQELVVSSIGTYTLTVTDSPTGCMASTDINIFQNILAPNAEADAPTAITCTETEVTLDGSQSSIGNNFTYLWTTTDGTIVSGEMTLSPLVSAEGTYTLTVTNLANGCTAENDAIVITDSQLPTIDINPPAELTCTDISTILDAVVIGDITPFDILWTTTDGNIISGANTLTPTVNAGGTYILTLENSQVNGCMVSEQVMVIDNMDAPTPDIQMPDELTCTNTTTILDASNSMGNGVLSALWSTLDGNIFSGGNTLTPIVNQAGLYTLVLTQNSNGCTASMDIMVDENMMLPTAIATVNGQLDCVTASLNLDGTGTDTGAGIQYLWTTADGNIVSGGTTLNPLVNEEGTYTITVSNQNNGCENTANVFVSEDMNLPTAVAGADAEINCTTGDAELNGNASSGAPILIFVWTTDDGQILSGGNTPTPIVSGAGNYLLTVTHPNNGCTAEDEITVTENTPIADIESTDPACSGTTGSITVTNPNGGTEPYLYSFDNGNSFGSEPTATDLSTGNYQVIVADANNCTYSETVFISAGQEPEIILEAQVNLLLGEVYQADAQINFPPTELASVTWTPANGLSCTDCLNPIIVPGGGGTYLVTVTTIDGCTAEASINIIVDSSVKIYSSNAFSPNNDGINDFFMIQANEKTISNINSFLIFDRWGESVFEVRNAQPNSVEFGWDGTFLGKKGESGVYVWFAEILLADGSLEILKGEVLLMR